MAGRLPSRHALASVHAADDGHHQRFVHHSDDRSYRDERVVSHLPDGARLRRARRTRRSATSCRARVTLTLATNPAGLQVKLDGQPTTTPVSFDSVVGVLRTLGAPSPQTSAAMTYEFVSWSDGGAASHHDLDTRGEHDLHGHLPREHGRRRQRAVGDLLQQHRLHRHDRHARRSDGRLHLGLRLAGGRRSAPTRSARAGPARSSRSSPAPTRSTRSATTACGCG